MNFAIEIWGTLAGILVMISYAYNGKKLRIINLIGSFFFVIYGVLLGGISMIVLNSLCVIIHLRHLIAKERIESNH